MAEVFVKKLTATKYNRGGRLAMPNLNYSSRSKKIQGPKKKKLSVAKKSSQPYIKATSIKGKKKCSFEGCTNLSMTGGVCWTHGAKRLRGKRCNFTGCTIFTQGKQGLCTTHGTKVKRCSVGGCTNQKGRVCVTHGVRLSYNCTFEGCTKNVVKGGVCVTHGAEVKRCSFEGCTNQVVKAGVCITHGAKKI